MTDQFDYQGDLKSIQSILGSKEVMLNWIGDKIKNNNNPRLRCGSHGKTCIGLNKNKLSKK